MRPIPAQDTLQLKQLHGSASSGYPDMTVQPGNFCLLAKIRAFLSASRSRGQASKYVQIAANEPLTDGFCTGLALELTGHF